MIELAAALNAACTTLRFTGHPAKIDLGASPVSNPLTYQRIQPLTDPLLKSHCGIVVATDHRYDNNHFFDSDTAVVVASFADWDSLTSLPRTNGLLGFVLSILAGHIYKDAPRHNENTGCVYDYLWDKKGIDMRLRAGAVCGDCHARIRSELLKSGNARVHELDCTVAEGFADMNVLLDTLAMASRWELELVEYWGNTAPQPDDFDVFLCHNSEDKSSVRVLYGQPRSKGINPWFDEEHLIPRNSMARRSASRNSQNPNRRRHCGPERPGPVAEH